MCSALAVWLSSWEPTTREMIWDMGETFFGWSEQADQATPMGRAELRGRLGRVDDKSRRRHLQEEDPLSAFQQGQGC